VQPKSIRLIVFFISASTGPAAYHVFFWPRPITSIRALPSLLLSETGPSALSEELRRAARPEGTLGR